MGNENTSNTVIQSKNKMLKSVGNLILIFVLFIIGFPFFVDNIIVASKMESNISNEQWISFLSSFIGGAVGGLITLVAIFFTIKQSAEIQQENIQKMIELHEDNKLQLNDIQLQNKEYQNKRDLSEVRPFIHFNRFITFTRESGNGRYHLEFKNVGKGIPINLELYKISLDLQTEFDFQYKLRIDDEKFLFTITIMGVESIRPDRILNMHFKFNDIDFNEYYQKSDLKRNSDNFGLHLSRSFLPVETKYMEVRTD